MRKLIFIALFSCTPSAKAPVVVAVPVTTVDAGRPVEVMQDLPLGKSYLTRITSEGSESYGYRETEPLLQTIDACRASATKGQRHGYLLLSVHADVAAVSMVERDGLSDALVQCVIGAVRKVDDPIVPVNELWYVRMT